MVRRVNDDLVHAIAAAKGAPTDGSDGTVMRLAEDQFQVLVDLLTPGYELALAYKAQMEAETAHRAEYEAKEIASADEAKLRDAQRQAAEASSRAEADATAKAAEDASRQGSG